MIHLPLALPATSLFPFRSLPVEAALLFLLAGLLFAGTVANGYALDDEIIIWGNRYVQAGVSGIPSIFTGDAFEGRFGANINYLPGGRYRPLPIATFAMEHQLWGENPHIGHGINALFYALGVLALFMFLRQRLFRSHPDLAIVTALLFAVHPIHVEAVANLKSRDELLSFLFLILALSLTFASIERGRKGLLAAALGFYFLALLCKENGLTFLAIVPAALFSFTSLRARRIAPIFALYALVAAAYLALRFSVLGTGLTAGNTDVLNNPYINATAVQKYGTIFFALGKYLTLLIWPYPLSWDYSYPAIPYVGFSNLFVLISVLLHAGLGVWAIFNLKTRNVFAFPVLFYLSSIFIVSNLAVNIGAAMGERLAFQASLGLVMAAAASLLLLYASLRPPIRLVVPVVLGIMVTLASAGTIARARAWFSDETLLLADVKSNPESSKTNQGAGSVLLKKAQVSVDPAERRKLLEEAKRYLERSISLYPGFAGAYFDLGRAYGMHEDMDRAELYWNEARRINPRHVLLKTYDPILAAHYRKKGVEALQTGQLASSQRLFARAVEYGPDEAMSHYDLALALYAMHDFGGAVDSFGKAARLNPKDAEPWNGLGLAQYRLGRSDRAIESWEKALVIEPDHASSTRYLEAVRAGRGIP